MGDFLLTTALTQKMNWDEQRLKVLSQNIANADTPGYRPQDVEAFDFKTLLESSTSKLPLAGAGLATTNPKHITSSTGSGSGGSAAVKPQKKTYEVSPSGNAVVLEEQLLKTNETMMDHDFIANLYQKQMSFLKSATKSQ